MANQQGKIRADTPQFAPIAGHVQVRGGQPMAQAVQQEAELTAPLSAVATQILTDLQDVGHLLDALDMNSALKLLRPEHGDPQGLTQCLLAIVNEVHSLRMQVDSMANRIGAL